MKTQQNVNMRSGGTVRLSVHGSRTLSDERVKILLLEAIDKYDVGLIVTHAEPEGVCEVARQLCKDEAIPLKLHFLNFKYRAGAFEHRSKAVLQDADRAIFIHDGKSKGCANERKLADKAGLPYDYHHIEPTPYKRSVGFDVGSDWSWDNNLDIDIEGLDMEL